MTFRARLVLAAAYLLAVVVVALAVPLALSVDRRATSELESDVVADATVLSGRVADLVRLDATDQLTAVVDEATVGDGARTVVVDGTGAVLADTDGAAAAGRRSPPPSGRSSRRRSSGRVDVRERHSDTLGEDLLLVTVPVTDRGEVIGALRVSRRRWARSSRASARAGSRWRSSAWRSWPPGLVLAWILAGTIARPVEKLRAAAGRLGRGDLDARVEPEGPQEIDELGRSFNRMAGELSCQPRRTARLRRERLAPAPHAADRHQAPPGGDPRRGRHRGRAGGEGRGGARPPERARRRPARARARRADQAPGESRRSRRGRPGRRPALGGAGGGGRARARDRGRAAAHDLGRPGRRRAHPRQPARERHPLLAARSRIEVGLDLNGGRPGFVVSDTGPGIPAASASASSTASTAAPRAGARAPGPGSGSPSSPSSRSAGRAPSSSSTAPAHGCARAFRLPLPSPHPRLTIPEGARC